MQAETTPARAMPSRPADSSWTRLRRFAKEKKINSNVIYILPALLIYVVYTGYPVVRVIYDSLFDWDGIHNTRDFIGLGNYVELLTEDRLFRGAIKNNIIWFVVTVGVLMVLGFTLAYLLNLGHVRLRNVYRTIIFLPLTASAVVVGLAWNNIYHPTMGLLNGTLEAVGLESLTQIWLGNPKIVLYAILVVQIWAGTGSWVVIFLAGLQAIPDELFEAATIDGANGLQRVRHVAIPLLAPTTRTLLILGAIGAVRAFGLPYLMTRGGPYHASELMSLRVFDLAFMLQRTGYASALSIVLLLIAAIITAVQLSTYRGAALGE
jgi:raffinose/stachyose/melibiose transport system permease protein